MELSTAIARHQRSARGRPKRWAMVTGAGALAASVLLIAPAQAAAPDAVCHSTSSTGILNDAAATLRAVDESLSWMQSEFDHAGPASPAAWRLREELDRLHGQAELLTQLGRVAFIRGDATPGTLAQYRTEEELDLVCDAIALGD